MTTNWLFNIDNNYKNSRYTFEGEPAMILEPIIME